MRPPRPRDRTGRPLPYGAPDEMPGRVEPDDAVSGVDAALATAVRLAGEGRYFEAHEFLEWVWKAPEVPDADRDFWKGVTQVVVAGVHVQRGNAEGAVSLAARGAALLARYPVGHGGVDTQRLRRDAEEIVRAGGAEGQVAPPRLRLLG
jgi:hypothetical protein